MSSSVPQISDRPLMSDVVYGTWRLLDDGAVPTVEDLKKRFELCLEFGITTIDTAEIYGLYAVEEAIGECFRAYPELRDRLQLVTKCGIDIPSSAKPKARLPHYDASAENLATGAEKSLQLLGTDRLDLFLVHRPDWFNSADDTAAGLTQLVQSGKVLHVGVSNYTAEQFSLLQSRLDFPLVTNQVEISLLKMDALTDGTLAQAEQRRFRPMAWSPLAGGAIFSDEPAAVRVRRCMDEMRHRYGGADDDALAFAWVMAHPSRPVTIIGSNQPDRIRSQASAATIALERQDWYVLWEAAQGVSVP